ncbi:MAG: hypothetical protein ACM3ZQ_07970, partial [Bacillota bacterium]
MQKTLHTWAEGQQWEIRGDTVHGSWGGYLVSLRDLGRTTLVLTIALPPISQDVQAKLVGFIARNRRSLKIADHTYNSQVQTIVVKQQVFSLKPIDITTVLTAITDEMNALDIPGQD